MKSPHFILGDPSQDATKTNSQSGTFEDIVFCNFTHSSDFSPNPSPKKVQEQLYEEICHAFPNRKAAIIPDKFEHMSYFKAVQKENHRRFPIAVANARVLQSDTVLKGYKIPKGSFISMEWGPMANHKDTFPDPEVSQPCTMGQNRKTQNK